jgi:cytochrome c-type biogenesis protein
MNQDLLNSPLEDEAETFTLEPRIADPHAMAEVGEQVQRRRARRQVLTTAGVLALVSVAALILLLTITGGEKLESSDADATVISQPEVTDALLRTADGEGSMEIQLLYAPDWYYNWSGRAEPPTDGTPTMAFLLFETTHIEDLSSTLPDLAIVTRSGLYVATEISIISDSPHHRASQVLFSAEDVDGNLILDEGETLAVAGSWDNGTDLTMEWTQPLPFGLGVLNPTDATATTGNFSMPALSLGAIAAIFSGMLAALTPCLLLLTAYYTSVLSSTAAAGVGKAVAERRVLMTGLFFVGGFTAVYTAGGVIAGYVAASVSRSNTVGTYARPVSIIAGVAVVLMGIRMASQARVPVVCKLPVFNRPTQTGWVASAVMGSTFAVGCLSCFSATVLTALLLFAGASGSPIVGGLIMLMFSAGVGVIFLLAAFLMARAAPVAKWLTKAQPVIGAVSAVVMIVLGALMITYKFHTVTGYLFTVWS